MQVENCTLGERCLPANHALQVTLACWSNRKYKHLRAEIFRAAGRPSERSGWRGPQRGDTVEEGPLGRYDWAALSWTGQYSPVLRLFLFQSSRSSRARREKPLGNNDRAVKRAPYDVKFESPRPGEAALRLSRRRIIAPFLACLSQPRAVAHGS